MGIEQADRGEAGTSGFLSISDSDRRVPAGLGHFLVSFFEKEKTAWLSSVTEVKYERIKVFQKS